MLSPNEPLFIFGVALIALAYSSVGHGGASGYLALMAFSTVTTKDASALALAMNLVVAGISFLAFRRAKHFDARLAWPFLLGAAPFAFLGGSLKLPGHIHKWMLAGALAVAAYFLFFGVQRKSQETAPPGVFPALGSGACIGLISGIVGVGGGIFLGPLMILFNWADAKRTASVSALFVFVNSIAGLVSRPPETLQMVLGHWPMLATGTIAALCGAIIGANWLPNLAIRRLLAIVLLVAVFKLATA